MGGSRGDKGVGRLFLILLWIVMLAASFFLITTFLNTFFSNPSTPSLVSLDWSGYVVVSDFSNPQSVVIGVNGSWNVPQVTVSQADKFSAAWIGIGGYLESTLIQAGTEHDSIDGTSVYSVWYELLPNESITIDGMNVSPGDGIQASIRLVDSVTNKWSIQIADVTTNQAFTQNVFYNSSRSSAEWIVERPYVNNTLSSLADFNTVTFTGASVTMNNSAGTISNFPFSQVIMHNRQNAELVTVSRLSSRGSSFTVNYLTTPLASQLSKPVENRIAAKGLPRRSKTLY